MRVLILTGIQGLWQLTPAMSSSAAFSACLNNRWQSHFWSFCRKFFSCFHCWLLHTCGIAIALTMGSSIAFVIHSVDRSFDLLWAFRGWCAGDLYRSHYSFL